MTWSSFGRLRLDYQTEVLVLYLLNLEKTLKIFNHSVLNQRCELVKLIWSLRVVRNPKRFITRLEAEKVATGIEGPEELLSYVADVELKNDGRATSEKTVLS